MTRCIALTIVLTSVLPAVSSVTASRAHAATFPGDASYLPLRCGGNVMTDLLGDQPPALADRDLVGDSNAPAGLRASDAQFLYLRIRVDQDPAPGGNLHPYAWGMELDLDGDRSTYELLISVDGIAAASGTVSIFTNRTTTLANDPADPADTPAAATATFVDAARTTGAGTTTGGNADFFVDIAIPWTMLVPLGLDRDTRTYVWAGSSSVASALDGDIACHDGRTGRARLEGGGGCQAGGSLGITTVLALLIVRRRRASTGEGVDQRIERLRAKT